MQKLNIQIPFDTKLSKNRAKTLLGRGTRKWIGLTSTYRTLIAQNIQFVKAQVTEELKFNPKEKVHLAITVFKPNNRCDAINFIDAVADIIKEVIGVDDRYYALSLDWFISEEPNIQIRITQANEDGINEDSNSDFQ